MHQPHRTHTLAALVVAALTAGCNALTGAGDLEVLDESEPGGGGSSTTTGGTGATASSGGGSGGAPTTSGGGGLGGTPTATGTTSGGGGASTTTNTSTASTTTTGTTTSSGCPPCGSNELCEAQTLTCVCSPGFVKQGSACVPTSPGDPTTRTQEEVCAQWAQGHVVTEPNPLIASGEECDPGTLRPGAITDTLVRINLFRWLAGLGPTTADDGLNASAQKCANMEAFWPWQGGSPHHPPESSKCYTPEGAAAAGSSNLAWGSGSPAQAINQYMQDNGNETTMGHRCWIMNPPLGPVGIGYWQTGGKYGNAQCLGVFGQSGGGPKPAWVGVPNAGFVPLTIAQWTWTFHASLAGVPGATITMLRVDDNTPLEVTILPLQQGYGQYATTSWRPKGWTVEAGKTYRVTVGLTNGDVVYDVKPVSCN